MNKFKIFSCLPKDESNSPHVVLSCVSDPSFMLFFPIPEEIASVLNYLVEGEGKYDINTNVLGIYKTMIDSWLSSERFLSGIIMDSFYDKKSKDDLLLIRLAIADQRTGNLESMVPVNFIHAMCLAAMQKSDIVVSDELLSKMVPKDSEEFDKISSRISSKSHTHFPEDKEILDIAKKIMSGKITPKDKPKDSSKEKEK